MDDGPLRNVSYQSVLYAFNNPFLASIQNGAVQQSPLIVNTNILATSLLRAQELKFLTYIATTSVLEKISKRLLQDRM